MRTITKLLCLAALVCAIACGDGDGADDDGTDGDGGQDGGGQPCQENCADASTTASSCTLVDLIIAVDGSGSMEDELIAIRDDVFPKFATRLAQVGDGLDNFRVGTIDACPDPANYHTRGSAGECNFSSSEAWIDSASPTLDDEFACVGDIFLGDANCTGDNDDEQPASTAAASLEPPYATGSNLGFSRPDALLVVLAITDEDEQPTGAQQSAQQVFDRIVATKGDAKRVVFIGIGGSSSCTGVYGDADEAVKLKSVTDLFIAQERGVWQDLCVGNLEDSLDTAFQVIEQACDELPPIL